MKKIYTLGLFIFSVTIAAAQSNKQVQWTYSSKKIAEKTYEVHMKADINGNYHMYSQNVGVDGPLPTVFTFVKNPLVVFDTKTKEVGKVVSKYEDAWKGSTRYYEKSVEFIQVVKVRNNAKTNVAGRVEFMVCNESQCLPPSEVNFSIAVGG